MFKRLKDDLKNPIYIRMLVNVALALAFIAIYLLLCGFREAPPVKTGVAVLILYTLSVLLTGLLHRWLLYRMAARDDDANLLISNITLDVLNKLKHPVLIFDEMGKIVWYNRLMIQKMAVKEAVYGKTIEQLWGVTPSDIMTADANDGFLIAAFGTEYGVRGYKIAAQNKNYIMTLWNDKTEINHLNRRLAGEAAVIAYIMVDNLDEMMQYVQEKYRAASTEIELVLKDWADSVHGVLKEYERDRYLFLFDAAHLAQFVEERFSILDRIRDIRVGEGSLPVTISIGISGTTGALEEKDAAARAALNMALQRGGDQVAVRAEGGLDYDYYGGRNKGVQKRTKVRARVVANELIVHMSKSSNILIMGHRNADFDALGACAGLARLAIFCGVKVNIIANRGDPNLAKCFRKLDALPEYADMIISAADAQELISAETLLIIADVNNPEQYEAPDVAKNVQTLIIIDHHRKAYEYRTQPVVAYIEPSASSTCELVSEILEQTLPNGRLPKEEADIIFAGILLDTQQFTRDTGTRTFSAALYLRGEGAEPMDAQMLFKTELDEYLREAKFSTNVYMYHSFIAIAVNDNDDNTAFDRIAAAKAANSLLSVEGVLASFALCRIDDTVHISARSTGTVNVQLILERLNGGGHFNAAGAQLSGEGMTEALTRLKTAIDDYLNEN